MVLSAHRLWAPSPLIYISKFTLYSSAFGRAKAQLSSSQLVNLPSRDSNIEFADSSSDTALSATSHFPVYTKFELKAAEIFEVVERCSLV